MRVDSSFRRGPLASAHGGSKDAAHRRSWCWSDFPAIPHGNSTGHSRHCLRRILARHFEEAVPPKAV